MSLSNNWVNVNIAKLSILKYGLRGPNTGSKETLVPCKEPLGRDLTRAKNEQDTNTTEKMLQKCHKAAVNSEVGFCFRCVMCILFLRQQVNFSEEST